MEMTTHAGNPAINSQILGKSVVDRTTAGAHEAVDKIAGAAAPAIDRIAAGAHQAVDKFAQTAVPAAKWLDNSVEKLNESRVKVVDETKQYVRDNPLIALGAAVALGALISYLARNRLQ